MKTLKEVLRHSLGQPMQRVKLLSRYFNPFQVVLGKKIFIFFGGPTDGCLNWSLRAPTYAKLF